MELKEALSIYEAEKSWIWGTEFAQIYEPDSQKPPKKITVEDVSKKRSMDLRLLYGVAYGHSWFGKWGYKFCRGSFGVAEYNYNKAIEILSSLELDQIIQDFSNTDQCRDIKQIIRHCRNMSETQLVTIKDLLRFMLTVKFNFVL
ncbi:PHD finger protein MALE MEIOCYTE DEATH 1 [Fagus crenata]